VIALFAWFWIDWVAIRRCTPGARLWEIGEGLLSHSDAGSYYDSIKFSEELMLERIIASIGSVGDAYDCQSVLVGLLVDSEDLTSAA